MRGERITLLMIVNQLSEELELARTLLYDSVLFFEEYPEIVHTCEQSKSGRDEVKKVSIT